MTVSAAVVMGPSRLITISSFSADDAAETRRVVVSLLKHDDSAGDVAGLMAWRTMLLTFRTVVVSLLLPDSSVIAATHISNCSRLVVIA